MIKCVVPVSGGKDSQACLKLALQKFALTEIVGLFCDTGFEHPLTYAHIQTIRDLYGVRVDVVNDGDVPALVRKYKRFPSDAARFCTDELKIKTGKRYYKALAEQQRSGFEVWYGMRTSESHQRAERYVGVICDEIMPPHLFMPSKYPAYFERLGIFIRLPIVDWSAEDVFDFVGDELNPLYKQGFDRVGCFPCLAGGDFWKAKSFGHDEFGKSQRIKVVQLANEIKKNVFTTKTYGSKTENFDLMVQTKRKNKSIQDDLFDAPPCMICSI